MAVVAVVVAALAVARTRGGDDVAAKSPAVSPDGHYLDPRSGVTVAKLFTLRNILGCASEIVSDRSGRNLLAVMQVGTAYFLDSWHVGGARPVRSIQGIVAAAWLP